MLAIMRLAAFLCLLAVPALAQLDADDFRINQIQAVGSHNSYKQAISPSLLKLLNREEPGRFRSLEYSHIPLAAQLDLGLRKLELDVVHDPEGGRYADPRGPKAVAKAGLPAGPPYDPEGWMERPGLKVLHIPDLDFRSNVQTFRQALEQLRDWSEENPRHVPVVITMNAKDSGAQREGFVRLLPFDRDAFDAWDAEIREVLSPDKLLMPDDVRGDFPTLEAAVLAHAWPRIGEVRGKFLFVLDETGPKLETYVRGHPSLVGRVMFVNAREGRPEAAFRIVNNPLAGFHYIQKLVRAGYMVRTRADANTLEARSGDVSKRDAAFASGAHFVSTDYYKPDPAFDSGYQVQLPGGGPARWNPLLAPPVTGLPIPE